VFHDLIIRQSLINDIITCPYMAYNRWILNKSIGKADTDGTGNINIGRSNDNLEDVQQTFMASVLGTAGHSVIEEMHRRKKFNFCYIDLLELFTTAFQEAQKQQNAMIKMKRDITVEDDFDEKADEYIEMLEGYQAYHKNNLNIIEPMSSEQQFVFKYKYNGNTYLFNGSIDHFLYYVSGELSGTGTIRDIKFKERSFMPSFIERALNLQFTIYSYAFKYGVPCCKFCSPYYSIASNDDFTIDEDTGDLKFQDSTEIIYNGPCDNCRQLIGTPVWPNKFIQRCELVWMRDFNKRKRKHGRHKAGEYFGQGVYVINRSPSTLNAYMAEVIKLVESFCMGLNYRRPGPHCYMFCNYNDICLKMLNIQEQIPRKTSEEPNF